MKDIDKLNDQIMREALKAWGERVTHFWEGFIRAQKSEGKIRLMWEKGFKYEPPKIP